MISTGALVLLAACVISVAHAQWDQEARDYILGIHNDYRRNEGGCQINKLVYDDELEAQAKVWAEKCVFKHEMIEGRGENLAWDSSQEAEKTLIQGSAQRWFDEKNRYSWGQNSCKRSCHYTQLVWDKTSKVGCYSHRCANLVNGAANAWYLVCFYTPMGNWMGEQPYQKSCDKPCRDGQTPDNGLCAGEAIVPCTDDADACADWASRGECERNPAYMKKSCRKSCKEC